MEGRLISADLKLEDKESDNKLRPLSFDDYVGQEKIKQNPYIESAQIRRKLNRGYRNSCYRKSNNIYASA